ncbi:MAG: DNA-processing protein DprA [Bacteroidales bacterium]|nr:DNA-processing protein DprA [Bacteroidales bacterium]
MEQEEILKYKIAASIIPNTGPVLIRRIIAYLGSYEALFTEKKARLEKVPGIGEKLAALIKPNEVLLQADKEVEHVLKNNIKVLFYLDKNYPFRLKNCEDAPIVLYTKGSTDFNSKKIISIVGTRNATHYGKEKCEEIIRDAADRNHQPVIVSGLAYGIDICAHKSALKYKLPTIAVLGHGLSFMYPSAHKSVADQIIETGALVSEFLFAQKPEPQYFAKRNRIIAGLADATIVVESGEKGGALITAEIANSYNRDVFAFPGRTNDKFSAGCNLLIKSNRAALIENIADLEYILGWQYNKTKPDATQKPIFVELTPEEENILSVIQKHVSISIDQICIFCDLPVSVVSSSLINMEFNGLVKCFPGKVYKPSV